MAAMACAASLPPEAHFPMGASPLRTASA